MNEFDSVIIGFGKGGKTLAVQLASKGEKVALIEKSKEMYGGTCINIGCIPTKFLVSRAKFSSQLGGTFEEKSARFKTSIEEKNRLISALRAKNYQGLAQNRNVTIIDAKASFIDSKTVCADNGVEKINIQADKFFINTGSYSFLPPVKGLKESNYLCTSTGIMERTTLPERLVIIGAGYIGLEFASIFANFGSDVTVIQDGAEFLPREDSEIAMAILDSLEKKGIKILLSTTVDEVSEDEKNAILRIKTSQEEKILEADCILCATGRRPLTADLNLDKAGVEINEKGGIKTDEHLKTNADNIWAMGDVRGGLQFTYISLDDSRIVFSDLYDDKQRTENNRAMVPYSMFVDPPFSRAGMSENEAHEKGYEIKVVKIPASSIPKSMVLNQTTGLLKAIIDVKTDLILGVHLFCEESHEMINILKLAMDNKIPYMILRDNIYTHPTMSEALNVLFASVK